MRHCKYWTAAFLTLSLTALAVAATPATQPATQPGEVAATQEMDAAAPREAAKKFIKAMKQGDADAARALVIARNDQQRESVRLMAMMIGSQKHLADAAIKQFGQEEGAKISAMNAQYEQNLRQIDAAQVQIHGDIATLTSPDQKQPLQLRREDGQWKLDLSAMPGAERLASMAGVIQAMVKASDATADDIAAGKFKTVEDAKHALNQRMMQVMMANMPTSRPNSTNPSDAGGE